MIVFYIYIFVACMAAIGGSMRSIRAEWHEENYYATYVRPKYMRVVYSTGIPIAAFFYFVVRREALSISPLGAIGVDICCATACAIFAYIAAFMLGTYIYGKGSR